MGCHRISGRWIKFAQEVATGLLLLSGDTTVDWTGTVDCTVSVEALGGVAIDDPGKHFLKGLDLTFP